MQSQFKVDNKRIAKNTLYMYLRMFIILAVTLYTARVVIRTLGIDDYGIYNIIGGVVVLFSFINVSLRSGIQRFVAYELGRGDADKTNRVIATSFVIVGIFSIIFFIVSETIGLWFVQNKLVIPQDRAAAVFWVYQFSVLTFIINLVQTPYQATIIAYEKMSFYAGYSIVEVLLKLIIAFLITVATIDKLIIYAALVFAVSIISLLIIAIYCHRGLSVPVKLTGYKEQLSSLFSYSGWSMMNSSTVIVAQQGGNILLNMFIGVAANGAFGIANQVTAAINGFVANFQSAFNPQITKSYSAGEYDALFKLINRTSLFSFCLLAIIAVPFLIESDYVLSLWLGECPQYAVGFCNLMIIYFLIDAAQAPLWMVIHATGKVRFYQIWSGTITLLNIPIAWYLLYNGFSAYCVFTVRVALNGIIAIIRPFYAHHLVREFSILQFTRGTLLPIFKITIICAGIIGLGLFFKDIFHPIFIILSSIGLTIFLVAFGGIGKDDRTNIQLFILEKLKRMG